MSPLFRFVVVIVLVLWAPVPGQAIFISQVVDNPHQDLRIAGYRVLSIVSEIFATVAEIEAEELRDASERFPIFAQRLRASAGLYDAFAQDLPETRLLDLQHIITVRGNDVFQPIETFLPSLSRPGSDMEVYLQAGEVLRELARVLENSTGLSSNGGIENLLQFRQLGASLWQAIDLMVTHSVLLSTTQ